MSWYWYVLILVILAATFVGVPSMLISIANTPAVLIGANGSFRGTGRYKLATLVAFLLQSIVAVTLSALIITYTGYMTSRNYGYIFAWLVGVIAAIYPMWQTRSRARHERLSEPDGYVAKEATHAAIPFALAVTVGGNARSDSLRAGGYCRCHSAFCVSPCHTRHSILLASGTVRIRISFQHCLYRCNRSAAILTQTAVEQSLAAAGAIA